MKPTIGFIFAIITALGSGFAGNRYAMYSTFEEQEKLRKELELTKVQLESVSSERDNLVARLDEELLNSLRYQNKCNCNFKSLREELLK